MTPAVQATPQQRALADAFREMAVKRVAEISTPDTLTTVVLARLWARLMCNVCGGRGECAHRNRAADLADISRAMELDRKGAGE